MTSTTQRMPSLKKNSPDVKLRVLDMAPFILVHLALFGVIWTGASASDFVALGIIYVVQMTAVTVGYHRYFSHRAFKTGRIFQFILAFIAQTTAQKGVLWWAAHHRDHHKYSDTDQDVHSPITQGFWYSHVAWIFDTKHDATKFSKIRDFARFPELRFLNKFHLVPAFIVGWFILQSMGVSGLIVGFLGSIVLCWHVTFMVNSIAHVWGTRPYKTEDQSRNNALLAVLGCGEGWHNNHHYEMVDVRLGTHWWQIDTGWYTVWLLSKMGVVSSLRRRIFHGKKKRVTQTAA